MIENRQLLSTIVNSLDKAKIKYTTNPKDDYQYLLVAELNQRIMKIINDNVTNNKKIIFVTYLEEYKIHKYHNSNSQQAIKYNNLLFSILNKCYLVVTSLPFFKKYLDKKVTSKVIVIERENPRLVDFKNIRMIKNNCLIIDYDYEQIINVFDMAIKYPRINFQVLGYMPDYLLSDKQIGIIHNLPDNIELIKNCDLIDYLSLIKQSSIVVYCNNDIRNYHYLLYIILNKRRLLIKNSEIYDNYFINSKNIYLYNDDNDFNLKLKKILNGSVANISTDAYLLIKDNRLEKFGKMLKEFIK